MIKYKKIITVFFMQIKNIKIKIILQFSYKKKKLIEYIIRNKNII